MSNNDDDESQYYLEFVIPPRKRNGVPVITFSDKQIWFINSKNEVMYLPVASPRTFTIESEKYFSAS